MVSTRSSICRLLNATTEEQRKALGEDRVAVVQGRRRSALKCLRKELLDNPEDDGRGYNRQSIVWGSGCIPSGGGKQKGRRPLVTHQNTASQTDPYHGEVIPTPADKTLPTLSCQSRDIQLSPPMYLSEVSRPGARFGRTGKLTQTPLGSSGPDILPLTSVLRNLKHEHENRNLTPNIKLNLWAPHRFRVQNKEERDSEWLELKSNDEEKEVKGQGRAKNVNHYCDELMKSLCFLFIIMRIGGRWPFKTRVSGKCPAFQLNPRSWPYVAFLLTSIVHFYVTAMSIFHTFTFLYDGESEGNEYKPPVYLQVQRLEFDKYWHYVFWTYITALFVCTWNLVLIIDGTSIRGLLNRWFLAVSKMQYEPTAGIRLITVSSWSIFTTYSIVLTICCFTDIVPAVRGSAGVIGTLFFSSAFPRIRFSSYFYLVRVFGLLFHLYTVYAAEVAVVFVVTCTELIQNSARNWNLRFALKFPTMGRGQRATSYKVTTYKVGIPLSKLQLEHQVITSFSRHTSVIFHGALNIYLVTKGTEMVLFIYRSFAFLLIPDLLRFSTTHVEGKIGDSGDRVVYKDSEAQQHVTCFFVTGFVIVSWFTTSLALAKFGEVILRGSRFVNRYELIVCKNAKERNFIHSISMQFGPALEYAMRAAGYYYNRRTISLFFLWVLIFALGLLSFFPFNLQKYPITVCAPRIGLEEPSCVTAMLSRNDRFASGKESSGHLIPPLPPPVTVVQPGKCSTNWYYQFDRPPSSRATTVLTEELVACSSGAGDVFPPYKTDYCARDENVAPYFSRKEMALFECNDNSNVVVIREFDQCGNIRLGDAKMKFVSLEYGNKEKEARLICASCYDYTQFKEKNEGSLQYCHMQSSEQARAACIPSRGAQVSHLLPVNANAQNLGVGCIPKKNLVTCDVDPEWMRIQGFPATPQRYIRIITGCNAPGKEVNPFNTDVENCFSDPTRRASKLDALPYGYLTRLSLVESCSRFTDKRINVMERDSCGNLPHVPPGLIRFRPIIVLFSDGFYYLVCCYDYYFMEGNEESIKFCHMRSQHQAELACTRGSRAYGPEELPPIAHQCDNFIPIPHES